MRFLLSFIAALTLGASASGAQNSAVFQEQGLAGAIETLEALPDPAPSDLFALGGAHFLRGVERALQTRYRYWMTGEDLDLPVLRLQVPPNPNPEPFRPELVRDIFAALDADMALARDALVRIGPDDFGAEIALGDLWFDINANGVQDRGETVVEQLVVTLLPRGGGFRTDVQPDALPVIRFDSADAPWLQAYTHFLSAFSDVVLAFDPTDAIAGVSDQAAQLGALMDLGPPVNAFDHLFAEDVDAVVMVYRALQQKPDAAYLASARDNLLAMIERNREVWQRIAVETDDDREWIPAAGQSAALGFELPDDTGDRWMAVLADGEALLKGEKLIPHWRMGSAAGINLAKMIEAAPPVDIVGWLQGGTLLPYAEQGERVSAENWRLFEQMMGGNALLFAVLLN